MVKCLKCGYEWTPMKNRRDPPRICAKCKSLYWNGGSKQIFSYKVEDGKKICSICKVEKPLGAFWKQAGTRNGVRSSCVECSVKRNKKYRESHPGYQKYVKKYKENPKNKPMLWASHAIGHERKRGREIKITVMELTMMARGTSSCPICGRVLCWNNTKQSPDSPSIDRIHNGNILDKKNVWIICNECNVTKGARSMENFVEYCKMISSKFRDGVA